MAFNESRNNNIGGAERKFLDSYLGNWIYGVWGMGYGVQGIGYPWTS